MEEKLDLRVIKTRKALTSALYTLMCQKKFEDIKITELCQEAMVRKATFYKHFLDKQDLLVYMIRQMQKESMANNEIGYDVSRPQTYYIGVFSYFINFIDSNMTFIKNAIESESNYFLRSALEEQIRKNIDAHLKIEWREDIKSAHSMLSAIYAGAIVGCGIWWASEANRPGKYLLIQEFSKFIEKI